MLEHTKARTKKKKISKLVDSKTVNIAYHANDPQAGLSQNIDLEKFKLFVCDTGLFVTLCFKDKEFTENIIYEKLLTDKLSSNLGYVYENVIAQTLKSKGEELYYHAFQSETSNHNYEIDFLISRKNKICPIESKSGDYRKHVSLDFFAQKYSKQILNRYIIYTKDYKKDSDIFCLPMYLTPFV